MKIKSFFSHPYLLLLLAPIFLSTSNIAGKFSVGILTPNQFTFYRWFLATLLLSCFVPILKKDLPKLKKCWKWLFVWGALSFCLFNTLLYMAIADGAKVVDIAIIQNLIPIFVVILNFVFFKQVAKPLQLLGVLISLFGVTWLVTNGNLFALSELSFSSAQGFILISALIYAIYSIDLRKAPKVHWISIMWGMSIGAMIVAFLIWIFDIHYFDAPIWLATPEIISPVILKQDILKAVALVFYVSIFVAILAKGFYMEGVLKIGANRASLVMNLLPIFNVIMALLLLPDERASFSSVQLCSFGLVCLGIFFSELSARMQRLN